MAETITIKEVRTAIKACAQAAKLQHEADAAAEIKAATMLGVFERLLGVKSLAEVAALSHEEIAKIAKARIRRGDVELDGFELDALMKVIQQGTCRRTVSWKDAFVSEVGESKAKELQASAMPAYSYKFVESSDLPSARAHAQAIGAVSV